LHKLSALTIVFVILFTLLVIPAIGQQTYAYQNETIENYEETPSPGCDDYIAAYLSTYNDDTEECLTWLFTGQGGGSPNFFNYAYGSPWPNDPSFSDVPILKNSSDSFESQYYSERVEPYNSLVHDKAVEIAGKYSGSYTLDQICAIYDYLHINWHYVLGGTNEHYANESIRLGQSTGASGVGNCEDFAIVMASMIEAIGGSARIIISEDSANGGSSHAYAEVYMGGTYLDSLVPLAKIYGTNTTRTDGCIPFKMFFHLPHGGCFAAYDPNNYWLNDYWLNLDWSANHPGGPFIKGQHSWIAWQSAPPHNAPNQPSKGRWVVTL